MWAPVVSLWAPVVAYMAAIFFVSGLSSPPLPEQVSDTTGHSMAYAGLAFLCVRAVSGGFPRRVALRVALLAVAIAAAYGAFDELHQWFVPERTADVRDWFADVSGALIGIGVCWLWGIIAARSDV
jgi:VanZ family protein